MDELFLLISGGYEGYRPSFSNSPNSGYGQTQFSAPRDYSNGNYQRVRPIIDAFSWISPCIIWALFSTQPQKWTFSQTDTFPYLSLHRMVTNRTINVVLAKGLEGLVEEMLKPCDLKSYIWTTVNIQILKCICPAPSLSLLLWIDHTMPTLQC